MKKLFSSIIALWLCCCGVLAEVDIPQEYRIKNRPPGYCCWCCLETLGRNQQVAALVDLAKKRDNDPDYIEEVRTPFGSSFVIYPKSAGTTGSVRQKLDSLKVKHKITMWDKDHLAQAARKNGGVVFLNPNKLMPQCHAVIITDLTATTFQYLDPNTCEYWHGNREWFDYYWTGVTITIEEGAPLKKKE